MCYRMSVGILSIILQAQIFIHAVTGSDPKTNVEFTRFRRETPSGGCQLPQHPQNGVYTSPQCLSGDDRSECRNLPGTTVPNNWLLKYHCSPNYNLSSEVGVFYLQQRHLAEPIALSRQFWQHDEYVAYSTCPSTFGIPLILKGSNNSPKESTTLGGPGSTKRETRSGELGGFCAGDSHLSTYCGYT
ncbi:uncharacterized protein LOC124372616, partial [Homalodisca vitripennis]|uniref:uncharacterized protein LOC124372616 n=1 Tax=Homalodisca vitripennis TaxID=197043 RepID=UPI001EEAE706